jgi:hypothetical protein
MIGKHDIKVARDRQLSLNFTLWELIRSKHRGLIEVPIREIIRRLELGANMLLQPIRDEWGRVKVNSGYRSNELNAKINGSENSDHLYGTAYDIVPLDANLHIVFGWCCKNLYYRQVVIYPKKGFLHISYNIPAKDFKNEIKIL